ncbi:TetR/AcrR family transcriptional regulator [Caballeronia novacaledonica]|uniref:TetR/AcrR family transcriptional regulator n=1 Tax=Caballeronia novacaledonica TaxID=1544861 RepID=A0ACB5R3H9_9BURK|nr:TetR/AcrR family transcriptional regulator [Caballeronia sp. NK8]KXV03990.1 hypothetical protein CR51_15205 [Caballeronia megalochromosomata]BCQ28720.1 TetR/AcrR family transcriptional regulator [Caballeronia sp. NK8]BCQ30278.1 TetR/AcrR family transcriptional regulator [Caballeronia sp. NK8]GJH21390.1 TetR/AcrR family transcriptional regulator [Caballeronia novacaledonica]
MKPKRLTREQRRNQTRDSLLFAARDIFSTKGFTAASVEDIAAAAGYTRGAFYSNFEGKSDLLLELLQRDHEEVQAESQRNFDLLTAREGGMVESSDCARLLGNRPASFLLWIEAKMYAARDSRFRAQLCTLLRKKRAHTATCISSIIARNGTQFSLSADTLALALLALGEGLQSWRVADPYEVPGEQLDALVCGFLAFIGSGAADRHTSSVFCEASVPPRNR